MWKFFNFSKTSFDVLKIDFPLPRFEVAPLLAPVARTWPSLLGSPSGGSCSSINSTWTDKTHLGHRSMEMNELDQFKVYPVYTQRRV